MGIDVEAPVLILPWFQFITFLTSTSPSIPLSLSMLTLVLPLLLPSLLCICYLGFGPILIVVSIFHLHSSVLFKALFGTICIDDGFDLLVCLLMD